MALDFSLYAALENTRERTSLFSNLTRAAEHDDTTLLGASLNAITTKGYKGDPDLPVVLGKAIDIVASKDPAAALNLVAWAMVPIRTPQSNLKAQIGAQGLDLLEKTERRDASFIAQAATTAMLIADAAEKGSPLEARAVKQWEKAVGTLAIQGFTQAMHKKTRNAGVATLSSVFGLAAQAATMPREDSPLRQIGVKEWGNAVTGLSYYDRPAAVVEIKNVTEGYLGFARADAAPLKEAAAEITRKMTPRVAR
jgi:hypothetical protein